MNKLFLIGLAVMALSATSCGNSGSMDGKTTCKTVGHVACDKAISCKLTETNKTTCYKQIDAMCASNTEKATYDSAKVNTCTNDISNMSCDAFKPILAGDDSAYPASCQSLDEQGENGNGNGNGNNTGACSAVKDFYDKCPNPQTSVSREQALAVCAQASGNCADFFATFARCWTQDNPNDCDTCATDLDDDIMRDDCGAN